MTHFMQPVSTIISLVAILLFYLCRRPVRFALAGNMKHHPPTAQPSYSRCPTREQDELCSDCGKCHYCDDVSLPCSGVGVRSYSLTIVPPVINARPGLGKDDDEDAPILQAAAGDSGSDNNDPPVCISYPDDHPEFNRRKREVQRIQQRVSRLMANIFSPSSSQQPYQHVVSPPLPPTITQDAADHLDSIIIGSVIPTPSCGIHWEPVDGGLGDHPAYQYYREIQDDEQTNGEQDDSNIQIQIVARTFQSAQA